jgi:hypothetical protein
MHPLGRYLTCLSPPCHTHQIGSLNMKAKASCDASEGLDQYTTNRPLTTFAHMPCHSNTFRMLTTCPLASPLPPPLLHTILP